MENFDKSGLGKLRSKNWQMPMCSSFIIILIVMLTNCMHAALLVICIYVYSYVVININIGMYKDLHMHCNWRKRKSATPFWVNMCEHDERNVISHRSMCIDWFPHVHAGMMEYSFTINSVTCIRGYHIYKDGWDVSIGKVLYCEWEIGNCSNPCTVAVKRTTLRSASLI